MDAITSGVQILELETGTKPNIPRNDKSSLSQSSQSASVEKMLPVKPECIEDFDVAPSTLVEERVEGKLFLKKYQPLKKTGQVSSFKRNEFYYYKIGNDRSCFLDISLDERTIEDYALILLHDEGQRFLEMHDQLTLIPKISISARLTVHYH